MRETSCYRTCTWTRWISGRGASRTLHNSQPGLGVRLSADFWRWNHDGNDVHDRSDRPSPHICRISLRQIESVSLYRIGNGESLLRFIPGVSTRLSWRTLYQQSSMDTEVSCCLLDLYEQPSYCGEMRLDARATCRASHAGRLRLRNVIQITENISDSICPISDRSWFFNSANAVGSLPPELKRPALPEGRFSAGAAPLFY